MEFVIHRAASRGRANHGWLDAHHTFSFANYYDPKRMNFGVLRVLNDDKIEGGMGFGAHPHRDMEIITIPLEGELKHSDNMGNEGIIHKGEIQVMSAGTGVVHSEFNSHPHNDLRLLQIWIFSREANVQPRYDQITFNTHLKNEFQQIVSPSPDDAGTWVHQDVWFHLGDFTQNTDQQYKMHKEGNGLYIFVIKGNVEVDGVYLETRDGLGVYDTQELSIKIEKDSEVLLMEVPMELPSYVTN